jgi:hypothetical protein
MSNERNVVGEIKNLMVKFGFMSAEDVKKEFAKLADGTEIRIEGDELAVGSAIYVVSEEGDIPAPDGVHILEDGSEVRTEGGLIAEIKVAEEAEEEVVEEVEVEAGEHEDEEKKEDMEEEIKEEVKEEIIEKLEEVEDEKEEVEMEEDIKEEAADKIVEVIVPILEKVKDLEEELKKVQASFEAFRNEPAAKPINKTKKEFSRTDHMVERILQLRNSK